MRWTERLRSVQERKRSVVCCGLDPDLAKMPVAIADASGPESAIEEFLVRVAEICLPHVCSFKLQKAFFDRYDDGHRLLRRVISKLRCLDADLPIIVDCKIGDIGNTMTAYLENLFEDACADAVVLNPYMGSEVWSQLNRWPENAGIVLVRTSNPGGDLVQQIEVADGRPFWMAMLDLVAEEWRNGTCLVPVLASTRDGLEGARSLIPDEMPIFVAGVGAQGGDPESVRPFLDSRGLGVLVNSSRGLLYPYEASAKNWEDRVAQAVIDLCGSLRGVCNA